MCWFTAGLAASRKRRFKPGNLFVVKMDPWFLVAEEADIQVHGGDSYVSQGGLKLKP